jgi:radical SAM protein with 4Fe4S-binding SPASM domain
MAEEYFKHLMIEPTNVCNLRCPVCPAGSGYDKSPKGFMDFPRFKTIIDTTKNFLESIYLWNFGEPFLAPDIMGMIDYVGKNSISMETHTNGNVLTKKMMDQFKKNYKLNISFSIDGLSQKTYGYYRVGGNLKNVLDNLSYLVNLKKKYNLYNLMIIWQFLIMKTNEHEVPQVYQAAKKIGVDKLRIKVIGVSKKHSRYNDFVPQNKNYRQRQSRVADSPCCFIDPGRPTITWNGNVVPCCYDFFKKYIIGNAFKENILNIWNSEKYRKFRDDYRKGINDFCNNTKCKIIQKSKIYIQEFNFQKL